MQKPAVMFENSKTSEFLVRSMMEEDVNESQNRFGILSPCGT